MRITSERRYDFPVDRAAFWAVIDRTDRYQAWWPWLQAFDADGLRVGDRWTCVIRPPLPYRVSIEVTLREVERPGLVVAEISGDLGGSARIDIVDVPGGCRVHLASSLAPQRPLLRAMGAMSPGLARSGHEAVLDRGAQQLADRLAAGDR